MKKEIKYLRAIVNRRRNAIKRCINKSWDKVVHQDEIGILKDMLMLDDCGIKYLNQHIPVILKNPYFTVKFRSVFSHKQPTVRFYMDKEEVRCELSDLLFLVRINRQTEIGNKPIGELGFLCQAKLNDIGNNNERQIFLYEKATSFSMPAWIHDRGDNGVRRFETTTFRSRQLTHLYLISKLFRITGTNRLYRFEDLFTKFLKLEYGLSASYIHPEWNKIVNDLVYKVGEKVFPRTNTKKLCEFISINSDKDDNIDLQNTLTLGNQEDECPSMIIVDVNFNRKLHIEDLMESLKK